MKLSQDSTQRYKFSLVKRLIEQGGITINDEKVTDVFAAIDRKAFDGEVILKKGKKIFKKLVINN